ncbi:MAG: PilZ domain-containing protein [Myxococcales bacterium]
MPDLKALSEALQSGLKRGALIHDKTGLAIPVEVVATEEKRLIAVARVVDGEHLQFKSDAKVRVELPQDQSVVFVPGRISEFRVSGGQAEVEMVCEGAEQRQRRMEVRVDADCRIRLSGGAEVEETRTVNLSVGGALVVSECQARVGEVVDVEMELEGRTIQCKAEVVRRGVKTNGAPSRTSAALKFVGFPSDLREHLSMYVLRAQASEKAGRNK